MNDGLNEQKRTAGIFLLPSKKMILWFVKFKKIEFVREVEIAGIVGVRG